MDAKTRAAAKALEHIKSGMIVGLGTGSTATTFIDLLADALRTGQLKDIRGVATSVRSDDQARRLNIPVIPLAEAGMCDVTVDGADEVDPNLDLIKGLGGALLREKIVAQNTHKFIAIVDESKIVPHLGHHCPLPVEVTQFAYDVSKTYLKSLGSDPVQRQSDTGGPYVTDNGNYYFHCQFGPIHNPAALDRHLRARAGILETGLFIGIAKVVVVASESSVRELVR